MPRQRTIDFESNSPTAGATPTPEEPVDAAIESSIELVAVEEASLPPESLEGKSVWVVDAHALIYQVFHAMPDMTGPHGQPIGAIHGFTRDILDLLEKKKPDYLICAFDHSDQTFRNDLYGEYKQSRESMPEDLRPQIANIFRMLDALGIPRIAVPGYEADDVLATVARITREAGGQCYLVTNDKDCWQLVNHSVRLYNIRKDAVLDSESLAKQWGIRPDQVVDFQALVGDPVDDVPGVPLIGPKIAGELLRKYETLEGIFEHASEISGTKRRENLLKYREQALVSRELVRLVDQVPLELSWERARTGQIDVATAEQLCREFGFRRLAERLTAFAGGSEAVPKKSWNARYRVVDSPAEFADLVQRLAKAERLSVRLQTTVPQPRWTQIEGIAVATEPEEAFYIVIEQPGIGRSAGSLTEVLEGLRPVLENLQIGKWGHDLKHVLVALRCHGIQVQGVRFDSMVADYLLMPGERSHELSDLSRRYLVHEVSGAPAGGERDAEGVAIAGWAERECENADLPLRLAPTLYQGLEAAELTGLFHDVEMPLLNVLADMEMRGIRVDVDKLKELSEQFQQRLLEMQTEIHALVGEPFNIDSPKQLAVILFEKMKLPIVKRTKGGEPSTDAEVLEELASQHELPAKIVAYRQIAKLKGTYVDALPALVHPETGRIHTSFKQDVAATGRLSSKDPNLQNIPIRTEEGRAIRAAFLPAEGWKLMTADYSQIELRILAHFTRDAALLDAFARDEDIHARVASEVFGVPLEKVPTELRRRAKAVNFGIIYGQTAFGLAKALNIPKEEAAAFIDAYFETYPGVNEFIEKTLEECRQKGYVSTILGRRRSVEGVRDSQRRRDPRFRTLPERIAINTVIQGSAADLIKLAMIRIHSQIERERLQARMLLQIHDELVFEVPSEELTYLSNLVADGMMAAAKLETPLKVDIKSGDHWAGCDPVSPGS